MARFLDAACAGSATLNGGHYPARHYVVERYSMETGVNDWNQFRA